MTLSMMGVALQQPSYVRIVILVFNGTISINVYNGRCNNCPIMKVNNLINLINCHSFALPYQAERLLRFGCVDDLIAQARSEDLFESPHLILGDGTNTLFTQDYAGTIIQLTAKDICTFEDDEYHYIEVEAGYPWHELVRWALAHRIYGLENLALIPGTVGAAPIQNIGAYGVEFADVCDRVEYLDKQSLRLMTKGVDELAFGYRDSIFKQQLKDKVVITKVWLKLPKRWQAVNSYKGLEGTNTPDDIFTQVIAQRQSKLPDPNVLPNAGSFFKNPQVSSTFAEQLKRQYAELPIFAVSKDTSKLSAAWLIEHCGFKGRRIGDIGVYQNHALILVNYGQTQGYDSGQDQGGSLKRLIGEIIDSVKQRFDVTLECEVQVY